MKITRSLHAGQSFTAQGWRWLLVTAVAVGVSGMGGVTARAAEPKKPAKTAPARGGTPKGGKITLAVPHQPGDDFSVMVEVTVGTLPRGARVVIRTDKGELVGAIAPMARVPGFSEEMHTLPLPDELKAQKNLSLVLTVETADRAPARPPTEAEIPKIAFEVGP